MFQEAYHGTSIKGRSARRREQPAFRPDDTDHRQVLPEQETQFRTKPFSRNVLNHWLAAPHLTLNASAIYVCVDPFRFNSDAGYPGASGQSLIVFAYLFSSLRSTKDWLFEVMSGSVVY